MSSPSPAPLDLKNVQGDILIGLPKKTQTYLFFQIDANRVNEFRKQLAQLIPLISTSAQLTSDRQKIAENKKSAAEKNLAVSLLKLSGLNISFSQKGLVQLKINDKIGDDSFSKGMLMDAKDLGDPGKQSSDGSFSPDWVPAFKQDIHGLILVTGDSHLTVDEKLVEVQRIFQIGTHNATIHEVTRLVGDVRPGAEKGHEHFGFLDGISNPPVQDVDTGSHVGQDPVPQGVFLLGRDQDVDQNNNVIQRPSWALDGSILAFRYLFQLVPEFNKFLEEHPIPGLPPKEGSELRGARLVGRWKSGAPIDVTPLQDDPFLGRDPSRNNDFHYTFPEDNTTQTRCPFAAHLRKTNPRADLSANVVAQRRIIRRGLQFGPEVTLAEQAAQKTLLGRGLLFASYQSNLSNGFHFIQHNWADTPSFLTRPGPNNTPGVTPGIDPIIGQVSDPTMRTLSGTDPKKQDSPLKIPVQWVVPKGGEYFFVPSIAALKETFAVAA